MKSYSMFLFSNIIFQIQVGDKKLWMGCKTLLICKVWIFNFHKWKHFMSQKQKGCGGEALGKCFKFYVLKNDKGSKSPSTPNGIPPSVLEKKNNCKSLHRIFWRIFSHFWNFFTRVERLLQANYPKNALF